LDFGFLDAVAKRLYLSIEWGRNNKIRIKFIGKTASGAKKNSADEEHNIRALS
jgi:hypothetical protein